MTQPALSRRTLGRGLVGGLVAAATAAADLPPSNRRRGIPLGFDNFAVRAMGWNARELIDHAEKLGCDSLFITDFGPFGRQTDDDSIDEIGRYAADRGVGLELGSWSICPTSTTFRKDWGSAEDHLALGIRMAKNLGSKAFRVILGNHQDRLTDGGISARIADTVKVLEACRSRAIDAGVKIAVENHAGDLHSRELKRLVEEAGPDFVGVNFDSGNALWTLEDPLAALETLAPHVVSTSLRDGQVWPSEKGVKVQWTAMGEGCVDLPTFFDHFQKHCPGVVVHIETISGFARELPFLEPDFWKAFPAMPAADFARFEALTRRGHAIDPFQAPDGDARKGAEQAYQLADLERSIRYCRDTLGLGARG
ncbi:MAG: sugar phosphate isomerase/epimerase [Planctomycetaceae bacterium]|nr:sugar phosphate isomerase/epimerase [Planctomycetaceae bacterium]